MILRGGIDLRFALVYVAQMRIARRAAFMYCGVSMVPVGFQLALALGAPLGAYTLGGAHPGSFPPNLRIVAVVQAALLVAMTAVVLARVEVGPARWRGLGKLIWGVVGISAATLVLNLLTPSPSERALWAPVALLLLASSVGVARKSR